MLLVYHDLVASRSHPTAVELFRRAWQEKCPACGQGRVFERRFQGFRDCQACGWRLLRDDGHWLGGSELNMLVSLPAGLCFCLALGSIFGFKPWVALAGGFSTVGFSLWFFRRARCLFYAFDYWVDPQPDTPGEDDDDDWLRDLLKDPPMAPSGGRHLSIETLLDEPSTRTQRPEEAVPHRIPSRVP